MEEHSTNNSVHPTYGLSVSYDVFAEPEYGFSGDVVLDSHKAKLKTHVDSLVNEADEINRTERERRQGSCALWH